MAEVKLDCGFEKEELRVGTEDVRLKACILTGGRGMMRWWSFEESEPGRFDQTCCWVLFELTGVR